MSDTVQSYFETGVSFLNRRQNAAVLSDTDKAQLFDLFCQLYKSDNQMLELMYRYFKCMNDLANTNQRHNELLLFISELYIENDGSISEDIKTFCEEYLNIFKSSKKSLSELKKEIISYFKTGEKTNVKVDKSSIKDKIGKIFDLFKSNNISYQIDDFLADSLSSNDIPYTIEDITIGIDESEKQKVAELMKSSGFKKGDKKTENDALSYVIPDTKINLTFVLNPTLSISVEDSLESHDTIDMSDLINLSFEEYKNIHGLDSSIQLTPGQITALTEIIEKNPESNTDFIKNIIFSYIDESYSPDIITTKEIVRKKIKVPKAGFIPVKAVFFAASIATLGVIIANLMLLK